MKTPIKKKKIKRIKKPSISKLKKKLWKVCTEFIRLRDKNQCFTCGNKCVGKNNHTGHFVTSMLCNLELRYDPMNLRTQCLRCNLFMNGNTVIFYRRMIKDFGQEYVDAICDQIGKPVVWKRSDYEAKILFYERALEMLKMR